MTGGEIDWIEELGRQFKQRRDPWLALEGQRAVEAALAGWWDVKVILAAEDCEWTPPLWSGLELTRMERAELVEIAGPGFQGGVIGLAALPEERAEVVKLLGETPPDALVVICPHLANAAHAGAILRNASALGACGVLFGDAGVSPYEREAVSASAGALFRIPVRVADGGLILRCLKAARFHMVGADSGPEAWRDLGGVKYEDRRRALVIGSEVHGLDAFWRRGCDELVRIPGVSGVDSLDPAAATALLLWQMGRR
ncbi:MAG: hypothetical protein MUF31_05760 [Akkermansiaceae bacterium]|jgi:tRNA G18 (ribose-2'-O)-methylase SpoU|nr:hypothetical protein [Akkermansiaceae bacterium]